VTAWRLVVLGTLVGGSAAWIYAADPRCPLEIRRYYLRGKAPQILVRNKATYPVGGIVLHVAYQDLFTKYHEPTQAFDTLVVQPNERMTLSFPPIDGSIEWESVNIFATCQAADSLQRPDSAGGPSAPRRSVPAAFP
jgi:hypothetical protein